MEYAYRKSTREKQDTSCSVLVEMFPIKSELLPNKIQWRVCRKKQRSHGDIDGIGQNTVGVAPWRQGRQCQLQSGWRRQCQSESESAGSECELGGPF